MQSHLTSATVLDTESDHQASISPANLPPHALKTAKSRHLVPLLLCVLVLIGLNVGMNALLKPKKPLPVAAKPAATAAPAPAQPAAPANANWVSLMPKDGTAIGSLWGVISGQWKLDNGEFVQSKADGFDMTISYREKKFSNFGLRVNLRHEQGNGAGVLINMPDPTRKNGAHVIRFTDDGKGIFWGHFDDNAVFVPQGFANTSLPPGQSKRLEVKSGTDTYSILFDGAMLAKDIPLKSKTGYLAVTNSVSVARFGNIEVNETTAAPQRFESINGQWVQNDKLIEQISPAETDFWVSTGIMAETYRINTKIVSKSPKSGGGFIFHMQDKTQRKLAHMVRFADGGNQIFWGTYNDAGVFMGQGDLVLKTPPKSPNTRQLELNVGLNAYDIIVDGEVVAKQIPLIAKSGWIGMLSFSGTVSFEDFYFQLGQIIR
ncbi:MAG: hypothetical protein KIH69_007180 [Anaerolineae bacterium]|nr:hypothetical protein [Anaerolineae bacterium]